MRKKSKIYQRNKKNIRNNNFSRKERDVVIKTSYKFELGIMSLAVFWLPVQLSIFVNYLLLLLPKVFFVAGVRLDWFLVYKLISFSFRLQTSED